MTNFKAGDIVQLKSGGPDMTIEKAEGLTDGKIKCIWFDGDKKTHDFFVPETLEIVKDEDPLTI